MDRKERLHALLQGEEIDRVLCAFWHHYAPEFAYGEASVKAHLDFFRSAACDIFKVMNEHMFRIDETIEKASDWRKVSRIPFENGPYPGLIEEAKAIRKALPADLPLFATVHGVLVSAYHATDKPGNFVNPDNKVSRHLREDPESVEKGLEVVASSLCELCDRLIDAGMDGIFYAALGGEDYRFDAPFFEAHVKPWDKMVIDHIRKKGALSILHICKPHVRLPVYQGIDADIINWDVHDCPYGLSEGRKLFPSKTLLGGFDDRSGILVEGEKGEIEQEASRIVAEVGRRRFILGADCTLPEDVAPWRIETVVHKARSL